MTALDAAQPLGSDFLVYEMGLTRIHYQSERFSTIQSDVLPGPACRHPLRQPLGDRL